MSHQLPTGRRARLASLALAAVAAAGIATAVPSAASAAPGPRLVPSNQLVYVPGVWGGKLHGVDPLTGATKRKIPGGPNPMISAPSPDGKTLYVVNLPKGSQSGISIVDVASGTRTFIGLKGVAAAEVLSNGGKELYAVDIVAHEIVVIDTATKTIARRLKMPDHVADEPLGIEISADNKTLYIAYLAGWVASYDTQTGKPIHEVQLPEVPRAVDLATFGQLTLPGWLMLSPDGTRLYALNFATGNTTVIDTRTWQTVGTIDHHDRWALDVLASFSPDGKKMYFTNYGTANVQVVDTATLQTLKVIPTKGRPIGVATLDNGDVLVDTIPPQFTQANPLVPIITLLPVGLTSIRLPNIGVGQILRINGTTDTITGTTNVDDTIPGAFVAPAPAA
ncbi:MAG: YncE family protein [Solirubrobacteraceae bacterium]|nr:YncE family protein [Patulibacter sp.]